MNEERSLLEKMLADPSPRARMREIDESIASGSEVIRRTIRKAFGQVSDEARLEALRRSAGSWKNRGFTGAEYVDGLRGDLAERLRRAGLD